MPTYTFRRVSDGSQWDQVMRISEMEDLLARDADVELIIGAPLLVSGVNKKPDEGFREVLRKIKRGNKGSTVNTF